MSDDPREGEAATDEAIRAAFAAWTEWLCAQCEGDAEGAPPGWLKAATDEAIRAACAAGASIEDLTRRYPWSRTQIEASIRRGHFPLLEEETC